MTASDAPSYSNAPSYLSPDQARCYHTLNQAVTSLPEAGPTSPVRLVSLLPHAEIIPLLDAMQPQDLLKLTHALVTQHSLASPQTSLAIELLEDAQQRFPKDFPLALKAWDLRLQRYEKGIDSTPHSRLPDAILHEMGNYMFQPLSPTERVDLAFLGARAEMALAAQLSDPERSNTYLAAADSFYTAYVLQKDLSPPSKRSPKEKQCLVEALEHSGFCSMKAKNWLDAADMYSYAFTQTEDPRFALHEAACLLQCDAHTALRPTNELPYHRAWASLSRGLSTLTHGSSSQDDPPLNDPTVLETLWLMRGIALLEPEKRADYMALETPLHTQKHLSLTAHKGLGLPLSMMANARSFLANPEKTLQAPMEFQTLLHQGPEALLAAAKDAVEPLANPPLKKHGEPVFHPHHDPKTEHETPATGEGGWLHRMQKAAATKAFFQDSEATHTAPSRGH